MSATSAARTYTITDEGDAYSLTLFFGCQQVGGGLFPIDALGDDEAYAIAVGLGESFAGRLASGVPAPCH